MRLMLKKMHKSKQPGYHLHHHRRHHHQNEPVVSTASSPDPAPADHFASSLTHGHPPLTNPLTESTCRQNI